MTLRRLLPYAALIVLFAGIYWLTMVIPDNWFDEGYYRIYRQRIQLQVTLFVILIPVFLLLVNVLEILTVDGHTFPGRLLKSLSTITLSYLAMAGIWYLSCQPNANLFGHHRVSPHINCIISILFTVFLIVCLEISQRIVFHFIKKSTVGRFIPGWLRMAQSKYP